MIVNPSESMTTVDGVYKPTDKDAEHVTARAKGGTSDVRNCQMLYKTHNRAKGNR